MFSVKAIRYALRETEKVIKKMAKQENMSFKDTIQALVNGDEKVIATFKDIVHNK